MREFLETRLQGRSLPLIMAHRGGSAHGKENAATTIQKALEFEPDIIEVDVRKSRNGVLYCHHGSEPFGVSFATFFRFLNFSFIQKLIGPRDTLTEVLAVIPDSVQVYLDIKDAHITADDLRPMLVERGGVWIAIYMLAGVDKGAERLKTFRRELGDSYLYAFNRPVLRPARAARKLEGVADLIATPVWSWNKKAVTFLDSVGMPCYLLPWFASDQKVLRLLPLSKYRGFFYSLEDLSETKSIRAYFAAEQKAE